MKIYSINDQEFVRYGRAVTGYETECNIICTVLRETTPLPENTAYTPSEPTLENLPEAKVLGASLFGGMPFQLGWCNGHNTKLNCLEYHRDSEFNLGVEDFILLLAKQDEMESGKLDTSCVKAFRVPAGILVEIYATTLHYAPCHTDAEKGFRVLVALPKGTNEVCPDLSVRGSDDALLWACNKWLLAHPDSNEAKSGANVGLVGSNLNIEK